MRACGEFELEPTAPSSPQCLVKVGTLSYVAPTLEEAKRWAAPRSVRHQLAASIRRGDYRVCEGRTTFCALDLPESFSPEVMALYELYFKKVASRTAGASCEHIAPSIVQSGKAHHIYTT